MKEIIKLLNTTSDRAEYEWLDQILTMAIAIRQQKLLREKHLKSLEKRVD